LSHVTKNQVTTKSFMEKKKDRVRGRGRGFQWGKTVTPQTPTAPPTRDGGLSNQRW